MMFLKTTLPFLLCCCAFIFLYQLSFHLVSFLNQSKIQQKDMIQDNYSLRVPRTLVLNFDHEKESEKINDTQQKGLEWAPRYYHILTPIKKNSHTMFRYDLEGYSYGEAQPLDIIWCGYAYPDNVEIHQGKVVNRNSQFFKIEHLKQYYKDDGRLVLLFGPIKRFCNSFSLYYQGHFRNFVTGLDKAEYKVIATESANNLY